MARLDGPNLIQELSIVVLASAEATWGNYDPPTLDPVTGLPPIDDPSSVGPPSSWGRRLIDEDPDGNPINPPTSGEDIGTRAPGSPSGSPPKRRQQGSPRQPNKNVITEADADPGPHSLFTGFVRIEITKPPPDPFGWDGQRPTFTGVSCEPYNPPTIPAPTSALGIGTPNISTQIDIFMATHVGSDASFVILEDTVSAPGASCTP